MADPIDHCKVGRQLASTSGVDLAKARPSTTKNWEARGLAVQAMARGDMAEALRIMDNIKTGRERGKKTSAASAPKDYR